MRTRILKVNPRRPELQKIREAAKMIKRGSIVAFPTETVYGLGANALDSKAVRKIFVAKGRPSDNPLIVHIYDKSDLARLAVDVPKIMDRISEKFWPGPLTVVLRKTKIVPKITTGGLDTVAVRMPSNLIARSLIREAGTPIAAPSANYFGRPSPTAAEHVLEDMNGRIGLVIDGGRTRIGIESTVIDLTSNIPILLRPGGVSIEQLQKEIGRVVIHPLLRGKKSRAAHRSPGMKYKHYTPNAQVILVEGQSGKVRKKIIRLAGKLKKQGKRVGVVCMSKARYNAHAVRVVGPSYEKFAASLFGTFREFDLKKIDVILVQAIPKKGIGFGIMNRLEKAASTKIKAD
ncbi:MAG: L-threonylcarbamoyladenylate synthase [Candidatus Nitrosotenuis sp.]|uniref:Threonylcarbamoyl-AMP synthase n=1 Tax=Candidatus Nitrosotenuis uzonensis TaxID=1407055 RepID=A0A812F0C8_9ARCH|nr:L-threonylcarbamoyladenylate synthase [Candidatus Nitrosotenuis uzonensis]MCA2003545.1 threonylcarbamoyl-AMP synthase [Candidatus Nitrosotenuis sp.]CAE6492294.1 Threonylcarbamoyl-AMP synthase [Candidatus Nitrosotenuis uzonensis]